MNCKKRRMFLLPLAALSLAGVASCGAKEDPTQKQMRGELDAYAQQIRDYASPFLGAEEAIKAFDEAYSSLEFDASLPLEENKKKMDPAVKTLLDSLQKEISPSYNASAKDISEFVYPATSSCAGMLKFNDVVGKSYGEMAVSLSAGRANYTAGKIAYPGSKAVYSLNTLHDIFSLSDSSLQKKMLDLKNPSEFYESSVASFNHDGRFVLTTHYSELAASYRSALGTPTEIEQEYLRFGTYSVGSQAKEGTNEYPIDVTLQDGSKMEFFFNTAKASVYLKNDVFESLLFAEIDEASSAGGGYGALGWDEGVKAYTNVAYGPHTMQALQEGDEGYDPKNPESETTLNDREKLDVYLPAGFDPKKEGGNGVIMFIHGGSWTSGEKEGVLSMAQYYSHLGYVTAAMNHTYATHKWEDGTVVGFMEIESEIQMAFAKIKAMSDENGWNLTKAATWGYSSGSHLAAWYAYDKGNEADAPIPVKLTFSMVGPMSFYLDCWTQSNKMPLGPQVAVIGLKDPNLFTPDEDKKDELTKQLEDVASGKVARSEINPMDYTPYDEATYQAKIDSISPLSFVKKGDAVPTILSETCLDDALISAEHGYQMEKALAEQHIDHDVIMYGNSDHLSAGNAECNAVFLKHSKEFLKKYFGY